MSHLDLLSVDEQTVVDEAVRFLPVSIKSVQVEVIKGSVLQPDSNPRTPVVSCTQIDQVELNMPLYEHVKCKHHQHFPESE